MAHKGHPVCPYTSKAKCEQARREAIGPCVAMLDEDHQCPHLGTDTVEGRAYCGQHIGTVYREADERERRRIRKQLLNERIDLFLAKTEAERVAASQVQVLVPQPRDEDIHWTGESVGIDTATGITVTRTDRGYVELLP